MPLPKYLARILYAAVSLATVQTAIAEPRNCYVKKGEIICQTTVDPFTALDPIEKGQVVYRELDERNGATMGFGGTGYIDGQSTLIATINKNGRMIQRDIKMRFIEQENDRDKRIIVMKNPRDAKGTALLTISNENGLDDQWLYSPEHKKVQRVARNNSGTSFAGTEIFYEDLSRQSLHKYHYEYLRKEELEGRATHVISRSPKDKYSAYSKLLTWVDVEHYYPVKVLYFDKQGQLLKTLTATDYQQYSDKFWRAGTMNIVNHQNNNSTSLKWSDYQFNIGLSEQDFSLNSLQRARNF
ncbi:MAG: outer membrane lipoprotein-sorting protein [Pseudomonadales bacterium]|nr:outer membrane lipoprotein-sorting protein [Pseudomonadales bacterium]